MYAKGGVPSAVSRSVSSTAYNNLGSTLLKSTPVRLTPTGVALIDVADENTLGSSDTAFGAGDVGKELFVGTSGAFILGAALANTTNEAQYCVGVVQDTSKIWIDAKQLRGIA